MEESVRETVTNTDFALRGLMDNTHLLYFNSALSTGARLLVLCLPIIISLPTGHSQLSSKASQILAGIQRHKTGSLLPEDKKKTMEKILFLLALSLTNITYSQTAIDSKKDSIENSCSCDEKIEFELRSVRLVDPMYPGGDSLMNRFIATNIHIPTGLKFNDDVFDNALDRSISINIFFSKEGVIEKYQIVRILPRCRKCTIEAKRIMELLPKKWEPAYYLNTITGAKSFQRDNKIIHILFDDKYKL